MKKLLALLKHILKGTGSHKKRVLLTELGIILSVTSYFCGTILVNSVYSLQLDTYKDFNPHSVLVADGLSHAKFDELKIKYRNAKVQGFSIAANRSISVSEQKDVLSNFAFTFWGVEKEFTSYPIPSIYTYNCIEQPRLLLGRNFEDEDFLFQRKVIILHMAYAKMLFGNEDPLGQSVFVASTGEFKVIGILKDTDDVKKDVKRSNRRVYDVNIKNNNLIIPTYTPNTVTQSMSNYVDRTIFTFPDVDMKSVYNILNADIYSGRGGNMFILQNILEDIQEEIEEVNRTIFLLMMVLLLLSGISLSTILSFSFKERISEIGLKKALGAKNENILNQFFLEALINGLLGGVIGLAIGIVLVLIIGPLFLDLTYKSILNSLSFDQLITPLLLSMLISVIFSFIPSLFAVNKKIIDALRGE